MASNSLPSTVDLFVSYAHADDHSDGGRIQALAKHIEHEYGLLSGADIRVFVDRTSIAWGEHWRRRIDDAVLECRFFVPIVTPRYLRSKECRRELFEFVSNAKALGKRDLLLPIIYAETGRLDESSDELAQEIAATQWRKWTDIRLCEIASSEYRRAVNDLAARVVQVAKRIAQIGDAEASAVLVTAGTRSSNGGMFESEPLETDIHNGMQSEALAGAEDAMQRLLPGVAEMASCAEEMGSIARRHTQGLNDTGAVAHARDRLSVMRAFASDLTVPTSRLDMLASKYARDLLLLEPMVLAMEPKLHEPDPAERAGARQLRQDIEALADGSRVMLASMGKLLASIVELGKQSRELRPPTARLRSAVQSLSDGQNALSKWLQLLGSADDADSPRSNDTTLGI